MTNNLNLSQVAAAQNQTEVTINDQAGELDAALTEVLSVVVDDANAATLTDAKFRRHFFIDVDPDTTPPDGAVTIEVPAIRRGLLAVRNNTEQTVTVTVDSQPLTAPAIAAGEAALLSCDGTNVRVEGSGDVGGGAAAFLDLADVPGAYTGHGGRLVRVNAGETGLEFVAHAYDFGFVKAETPSSSEVIGKVVIPRAITLPADLAGAAGHVDTNPTAQFDVDLTDGGSSIGTISIATNGTFTFTTVDNTAKAIAAGSVVRFVAPASTDATVAGIAVTLIGSLT
jgi:hypothetical protein